jgi:hypothetical protein
MNTKLCALIVMTAALSLPGCKTTGDTAAYVPASKPVQPGTRLQPRFEEDAAYIAYVERTARRRGITVHWVHKPVVRYVDRE